MRIHFENLVRPRLVAKALFAERKAAGTPLALSRSQEIVARMYGYADWHDLSKNFAEAPATPDDIDVSPDEAARRRAFFADVLTARLGISGEAAAQIVVDIRPTNRTVSAAPDHSPTPRLLVEARETDADGNVLRSLGIQDLGYAVIEAMVPSTRRSFVRELEMPPRVSTLSNGLSDEARRLGYDGRLLLVDFEASFTTFIDRIGKDRLREFREHLDGIDNARRRHENAIDDLAAARKAKFTTDLSGFDMFYTPHHSREWEDSPSDAYYLWEWDSYVDRHPMPDMSDERAYEAWKVARERFVEMNAPPFVYGTFPVVWGGLTAEEIRESFEDDEKIDIPNLLDNSLSAHYEDAYENVVDEKELWRLVDAWLPHAGSGNEHDLALERDLAAWNARQTIVSYYGDESILIPVRNEVTHADMLRWFERQVAETKAALAAARVWPGEPKQDPRQSLPS